MKPKRLLININLLIFVFIITMPLQAAPDTDSPTTWTSTYPFIRTDPDTHELVLVYMPVYQATSGLISSHCSTAGAISGPNDLWHQHWLNGFDEDTIEGIDEYWDARFWEGKKQ
jgi:hypothetical protein